MKRKTGKVGEWMPYPVAEPGGWVNACVALGCVRPKLARRYAAALLRAAEAAEAMSKVMQGGRR